MIISNFVININNQKIFIKNLLLKIFNFNFKSNNNFIFCIINFFQNNQIFI